LVERERSELLPAPHKILTGERIICQLLNICGAGGVRQTEMRAAERFVPETSASEAEVDTGKLKGINLQAFFIFQQK
jgi:hypothetical protein